MNIDNFLSQTGLSLKERKIFITLLNLGIQPASTIARKCNFDRVTTYKHLKRMADQGFVKIYSDRGIQTFGIENLEPLKVHLADQQKIYTELLDEFPTIQNMIKSQLQNQSQIPRLQIFEGESGVKSLFRDMLYELGVEEVKQIRILTSNTFEERLGDVPLSRYIQEFYEQIKAKKIDVEIFEAAGTLIPEHLNKLSLDQFDPDKFPAARGTTNIFLVGHSIYIATYKDNQIGLKIKHTEMSQIFHFLFDILGKI